MKQRNPGRNLRIEIVEVEELTEAEVEEVERALVHLLLTSYRKQKNMQGCTEPSTTGTLREEKQP